MNVQKIDVIRILAVSTLLVRLPVAVMKALPVMVKTVEVSKSIMSVKFSVIEFFFGAILFLYRDI